MTDPDSRPARRNRPQVLVVEDDQATSSYFARALDRAGFEVSTAGSAPEAVEVLVANPIDAMLVDIGLPGRSGFDLVTEIKQRWPNIPIALTTADASMDVAVRALRSQVDDFLAKPVAPEQLAAQVERLLQVAAARRHDAAERVLAVGAHPDDVEIGVGGTLLAHRDGGDAIAVLTMSQGSRGGDQARRATESARAAEIIGARLFLEDLDDTRIPESDPTVGIIERVIDEFRPTILYTHTIHDVHQDHRNVHRASLVAARRVPGVYCYESPSATVEYHPARFASIEANMDEKLDLIGVYGSQTDIRWYLDPELTRSTGRYWGRYGDARYCEPLEVVRDRSSSRRFKRPEGVTTSA